MTKRNARFSQPVGVLTFCRMLQTHPIGRACQKIRGWQGMQLAAYERQPGQPGIDIEDGQGHVRGCPLYRAGHDSIVTPARPRGF